LLKRIVSGTVLMLLTISIVALAFNIQTAKAEYQVGVKVGDWIKYDYTVTGVPPATPIPIWMKVEILSVEGTTIIVRLTMNMSGGTESSETITLHVARTLDYDTGGTFDTYFGFQFVIPANSTARYGVDFIYVILLSQGMAGTTNVGENTRTYAGASRTVIYATFSGQGGLYDVLKFYWDKPTGIMVEASARRDGINATAKATETNLWEAAPISPPSPPLWMEWWIWATVAVVIVGLAGTVYFLKKRKPPTSKTSSPLKSHTQNEKLSN